MEILAEFKECRDCKVDARLMNSIVEEEAAKGNATNALIGYTEVNILFVMDPRRPMITGGRLPGARVFKDMCTKCGKEYVVRIEKGHVSAPAGPGMPPTFA